MVEAFDGQFVLVVLHLSNNPKPSRWLRAPEPMSGRPTCRRFASGVDDEFLAGRSLETGKGYLA
jgi:hypothetical protein